jgi:hypothetical protein
VLVCGDIFGEFGDNDLHVVRESTESLSKRRHMGDLFLIGYDEIIQSFDLSDLVNSLGSVAGYLTDGVPL